MDALLRTSNFQANKDKLLEDCALIVLCLFSNLCIFSGSRFLPDGFSRAEVRPDGFPGRGASTQTAGRLLTLSRSCSEGLGSHTRS